MNKPTKEIQMEAALESGSLALFIVALVIAKAGSYDCLASEQIGSKGCVALGLFIAWIAGKTPSWLARSKKNGSDCIKLEGK